MENKINRKELYKCVERLGDSLGYIIDQIEGIHSAIKNITKEPLHNSAIDKIRIHIKTVEYYYTLLHSNLFISFKKNKKKY